MAKRILLTLKNVLTIPTQSTDPASKITHDRVVMAVFDSGFDETLLTVAASTKENKLHLYVAEIFALILVNYVSCMPWLHFNFQNIDDVIAQHSTNSASAPQARAKDDALEKALAAARATQAARSLKASQRHTNFHGHYEVAGLKAVGSAHASNVVADRVIAHADNVTHLPWLQERKEVGIHSHSSRITPQKRRAPKNRAAVEDTQSTAVDIVSSVTMFRRLAKFCAQLLADASPESAASDTCELTPSRSVYNVFMRQVKVGIRVLLCIFQFASSSPCSAAATQSRKPARPVTIRSASTPICARI